VIDTVLMPGALGATNWGMLSGDPKKGMAYVISGELPSIIRMAVAQPLVATGATPFERGQSIYSSTCAGCHGPDRRGSESFPSLVDITQRLPRDAIQQVVQRGRGHMPAFPHVREAYMADMMAFLANDHSAGPPRAAPNGKANPANPPIPRWRSDYGLMTSLTTKNPVIRPPWSQVTAYDLNTGDIVWQRPIGTDRNYKAAIDGPTGLFGRVGSALTAGGLMFVATGRDRTLHALDLKTGKTVWTGSLPAEPAGLPSVYAAGGRQFILVPAANSRPPAPGEPPARNAFVAFALPATR
jgi:quinoprotein glucose dehydrogenase